MRLEDPDVPEYGASVTRDGQGDRDADQPRVQPPRFGDRARGPRGPARGPTGPASRSRSATARVLATVAEPPPSTTRGRPVLAAERRSPADPRPGRRSAAQASSNHTRDSRRSIAEYVHTCAPPRDEDTRPQSMRICSTCGSVREAAPDGPGLRLRAERGRDAGGVDPSRAPRPDRPGRGLQSARSRRAPRDRPRARRVQNKPTVRPRSSMSTSNAGTRAETGHPLHVAAQRHDEARRARDHLRDREQETPGRFSIHVARA